MVALLGLLAGVVLRQAAPGDRDPTPDELAQACTRFAAADDEAKRAAVAEIAKRVEATSEPELRRLLAWRDRAVKELKILPAPAAECFDPKVYARGLVHRTAVGTDEPDAAEKRDAYRPWLNQTFYAGTVRYDFGRNAALDYGGTLDPDGALHDDLFGYPPGADRLVAWITARFDFDESIDPLALHFDHLYCDLNGRVYPEITLYDAWGSGNSIDMPDVDVIAFARNVLKDDSWVSPIDPGAAAPLYDKLREGFLRLFRYRIWIEAAANIFVDPEVPIRGTHEGLRDRLHYLFALDGGDLDKAVGRIRGFPTRGDFLSAMDTAFAADPEGNRKIEAFLASRAKARWAVARTTYAVLRERGLLARPKAEGTPAAAPANGK
jgi:hypothetical protein